MRDVIEQAQGTEKVARRSPGGSEAGALLTSPAFMLAVALLLLNDWVLKAALGNWLTGKLSDFAGLFAFTLFWTALLPRRRDAVFALTAAGFMLWKSPLSEAPLEAWNAVGLWPLERVVDYTDWLALLALVPAYRLARAQDAGSSVWPRGLGRRIAAIAAAGVAIAAFTATSVPPPRYAVPDLTGHVVPASRGEVRVALDSLGFEPVVMPSRRRKDPPSADTLRLYIRQPPEQWVRLTIELREEHPAETRIRILDASPWGPQPRPESIRRAFGAQVIEPVREWTSRRRAPHAPREER